MILLITFLLACAGTPVERCDVEDVDCCTDDAQCAEVYGDAFPYCVDPGAKTGICAQCLTGDDCDVYEICADDPVLGAVCAPRD